MDAGLLVFLKIGHSCYIIRQTIYQLKGQSFIQLQMSVKLPIIGRRLGSDQEQNPSVLKEQTKDPFETIQHQQQQHEDEEYNDHFESIEQSTPVRTLQPQEQTIKLLSSRKQHEQQTQKQVSISGFGKQSQLKTSINLTTLEKQLSQKIQSVNQLRNSISQKKKQIKNIGEKIDRDLNKSLLKVGKNQVNIRDIFTSSIKSNNQKINSTNEQIKQVRTNIFKIKNQLQKLQSKINDPISSLNYQKGLECESKLKNIELEMKIIKNEKNMLEFQMQRYNKQYSEQENKQRQQELSKIQQTLLDLQLQVKEQKSKMYFLQREDRILTEKINFYKEKQSLTGNSKKYKTIQKDKQVSINEEINQIIKQIITVIDQRNKIQAQKKNYYKELLNNTKEYQSNNLEICTKLRQIDATLLQFYDKKTKDKKYNKSEGNTVSVVQKKQPIKLSEPKQNVPKTNEFYNNDKNIQSQKEIVYIEKKKTYQFGSKQSLKNQVCFSDDFIGGKLNLKEIEIQCDQNYIYSINARYNNQFHNEVVGLKIGTVKSINQIMKKRLTLDLKKQQTINSISLKQSSKNQNIVGYFQITTTQNQQLTWKIKQQKISQSQSKQIKKYDTCYIKAKMIPLAQKIDNLSLVLSYFSIVTTYMVPK